jgi:hypothetical protein
MVGAISRVEEPDGFDEVVVEDVKDTIAPPQFTDQIRRAVAGLAAFEEAADVGIVVLGHGAHLGFVQPGRTHGGQREPAFPDQRHQDHHQQQAEEPAEVGEAAVPGQEGAVVAAAQADQHRLHHPPVVQALEAQIHRDGEHGEPGPIEEPGEGQPRHAAATLAATELAIAPFRRDRLQHFILSFRAIGAHHPLVVEVVEDEQQEKKAEHPVQLLVLAGKERTGCGTAGWRGCQPAQ